MIVRAMAVVIVCALMLQARVPAQGSSTPADERERIRQVALDYIDGWYSGDANRIASALHPELAKRMVATRIEEGRPISALDQQSAMTLVEATRAGGGRQIAPANRRNTVTVLDVFGNAASVRIDAATWIDYLHFAKWNGEWKIVNVLWELRPDR